MTRNSRFVLLGLAALVVVVAVIGIGGSGNQPSSSDAGAPRPGSNPTDSAPSGAAPTPTPELVHPIAVKDLKPVDGVANIELHKNDRVRFTVTSDVEEEVHVHGYDIAKEVGPGSPAAFDFEADQDGIYEVELENSAVPIARLRIDP